MAKIIKPVVIEEYLPRMWRVWADRAVMEKISLLDGVAGLGELSNEGFTVVYVDMRYDLRELKNEMFKLGESK